MSLLETQPYRLFLNSLRSHESRKSYSIYIKKYMQLLGIHDLLAETDARVIEEQIINFIIKMTESGKHYSSLHNYVTAVLSFYKINDIVLNTSKISKFMPEQTRIKKDRAYTHEEIGRLLEIADERMRVIILLMASTGMRIGALPDLRLRSLEKVTENYYKITVYENFKQEYFTFCSNECLRAIDSYLGFRKRYGEILGPDSFLIREQFDVRDQFAISCPKRTNSHTLSYKLMDIASRVGIRKKEQLMEGQTPADGASLRKEVAIAHGFRKFFTTQLVDSNVNSEIREMLLGHKIGLASAYYRPTEQKMYEEYEKAIDNLTIDPSNRLRRKVEILTVEKSRIDRIEEKLQKMEQVYQK